MAARSALRWLTSLTRLRVRDSLPTRPRRRRRLWLEQLEDRVAPARFAVNMLDEVTLLDGPGPDSSMAAGRREVVFYETSVADYEALLTGAAPGTDQVFLDARGDGVRQMAAFLAEHQGYDALAVVAHGAAGKLALGSAPLDAVTLANYGEELATLGAALNPQGDLLLYGCDVAAGAAGEAFVRQLAQATGADVAAARHRVGAAALGGSWQLDYQTGPIETDLPFAADQFPGVLPADQQNQEGDAIALPVMFDDAPAGTTLYFTAANLPDGLSLTTISETTTQVTGTIAAGAAVNGPFATMISASDVPDGQPGTYFSSQSFTWFVGPRITVSWIDDQENLEGDTVSLPVTAESPDGLPLMFTASGLPDGLSLTAVDTTSAEITGTIAIGAADIGFFETTITASDGTYSGSHTLYWFVAADPPDLTVGQDRTAAAGTPITLEVSATDPDGIASVEWWISFNGGDYELDPDLTSLAVQYTFPTYGEYDVIVVVTDGNGDSSTDGFHVTVPESAPTASLFTASSIIFRGDTVTFTAAVSDPDALDTVSLYVDWYGTGTFDQLDQAQLQINSDGSFSFDHVYPEAGNFTAVLRIADDDGEDTDYTVDVAVLGVTPSATLTTTSDYSWVPSGSEITTWGMRPEDLLQFTDVTPADTPGLEYHFIITEEGAGETEVVRETPTLALPDYTAGKRYQVRGYVKDKFSDQQSPEQALDVVVGHRDNGLWGTFAVDGDPPAADAAGRTFTVSPDMPTTVRFTIDPASLAVWPSNLTVQMLYTVSVYDIAPTWSGWGDPGRTLIDYQVFHRNSLTFELPGYPYPDHREIDVTAQVVIDLSGGGMAPGMAGPVPVNPGEFESGLSPQYSLTFFTNRPPLFLQQLANGLQLVRDLAEGFAEKAELIGRALVNDPGTFLRNLLSGLGDAVGEVFRDLTNPERLQGRLYTWLVGPIPELQAFRDLNFGDPDNVKRVLLQYAGLTWDHLQNVLKRQLGAGNYAAATKIATLLFGEDFAQQGNPPDLLTLLTNLRGRVDALGEEFRGLVDNLFNWQELRDKLVAKATEQLASSLLKVAPRLLAKFVPGVGVATSLYQGLSFLLANQDQIRHLFDGFLRGIDDLVEGRVGPYKDKLVEAITGPGLDFLLNFALSQLGLSTIREDLRKAIRFIPNEVDEAMRKVVAAVAGKLVNVLPGSRGNAGGLYAGQLAPPVAFTYNNTNYTLWVAKDRTGVKVKVASGSNLIAVLRAASFDNRVRAGASDRFTALLTAANNMARAADVRDMAVKQGELTGRLNAVKEDILGDACVAINGACFAAGTKLWTPQGYRNVEDIQPGEWVYSRDECALCGLIAAKQVEKKFERTGRILHLHLPGGKLIRTTPEHPFFVYNAGWTAAGALQAGDRVRTDGGWTTIEEVFDTGEYEPVYNLRVADYHTYFVGEGEWGFAVWAHNAYTAEVNQIIKELVRAQGGAPGSGFSKEASRTGERGTWANRQYLVEHLRAMLGKYYPGLSSDQVEQITRCAATRILRLAGRDPQTTSFVPQDVETYRPSSFTVPAELSAIAHRQYTLTNGRAGVQGLAPIVANLNDGGWEVALATALGDTAQRKARGVYILRDPESGKIYKVGKADSTGLVARLERYAKDWVARGIRVQAEVYKLPGDYRTAERVLRYQVVRIDGWDLRPDAGAADGSWDEVSALGASGWTVGTVG